ncbi:MAG: T9SS type A sorting domain-containing protein [Crocinitomicaceae bacterium]|nr:T9SS type A sorting domain-containing protein [Crocinitomicaceae bacterium]
MKKLLLTLSAFLAFGTYAQTILYSEDFETGGTSISLNATDLSSTPLGVNYWVINNAYTGGAGTVTCLGFPFSFTVPNTAAQPGGITGSINSNYLHIVGEAAVNSGINCSSFQAADGICTFNENNFSKMTSDISTIGYSDVTFDLYWMLGGSPEIYGEIYYSTDGGTTWTLQQGQLNSQTTWTQSSFTNSLWDDVTSLRFGFRFVNTTASTVAEPGFCIDEINITGTMATSNPAITSSVTGGIEVFCGGDNIEVDYTVTDVALNMGNTFTLELSDETGSFAAATAIGTASSTNMTGSITGTIPAGATPGMGYRVRVNSSDVAQTGTDNGTDLIIASTPATPTITLNGSGDLESSYAGTNIWFQDGFLITGESGSTITPLADGVYTVQATNDTCVSAVSDDFSYSTVGVSIDELNDFSIYPNPTNGIISLNGNHALISSLELLEVSGKVISVFEPSIKTIDAVGAAPGVYFLRVSTSEGIHTLKFIKK